MILPAASMLQLYKAFKSDTTQSEDKAALVFVANGDVDSLCSSIQLEAILGKSDMTYATYPVESYSAISAICEQEQLEKAEELKTIFMINCGATEDIRSVCKLSPNVRVIIIDSHRPVWHGYNRPDDEDTVVLVAVDDPVPIDDVPEFREDADLTPGERDSDDLDSESDDDSSSSGDEGGGGQGHEDASSPGSSRGKGRRQPGSGEAEGEEELSGAAGDGGALAGGPPARAGAGRSSPGPPGSRKRPPAGDGQSPSRSRKQRRTQQRQEQLEHRKSVEEYYLSKAGYGKPSALLLLNLAYEQQEDDNFTIWLAILGITDQYMHQRIDPLQYRKWCDEMDVHVSRHNGTLDLLHRHGQQPEFDEDEVGVYNNKAKHKLCVRAVNALKIPLMRHWNLYEALMYTHHIATRMQTWRDVGCKQLELFLTAMGITPNQRNAAFNSMHPEVMPHMDSQLEQTAGKFRIAHDALRYRGFEMLFKNDVRVLATDYVLAITAMLGRPRTETLKPSTIFREAVDCLFPQRSEGMFALQKGLEVAKQLAQAVVVEGGLVITRGQVQGGKQAGVWVCDLSELTLQNATLLEHPTSLIRLAFFLRDARAQRLNTVRPLVVVGPKSNNGMCYVVAIRATQQAGVMQNNPFAVPFQEALRDMGAGEAASLFTFDNSVFLIRKSAVASFVEELKAVVQAYRSGVDDARLV